jgi:hypothetical protein
MEQRRHKKEERAAFSLFIICGGRAKLLISKIIGPLNSTAAHKNPKVIDKPQQLSFYPQIYSQRKISLRLP